MWDISSVVDGKNVAVVDDKFRLLETDSSVAAIMETIPGRLSLRSGFGDKVLYELEEEVGIEHPAYIQAFMDYLLDYNLLVELRK